MRKFLAIASITVLIAMVTASFILPLDVQAQSGTSGTGSSSSGTFGLCNLLGPIGAPFGCGSDGTGTFGDQSVAQTYLLPRIQIAATLAFAGLIIFAIFYVVKAAITYIQSQGKPEKIAEATKAIRSVFIGLGALFVGIAGVLLVLSFAGAGAGQTDFNVICIERPQCCNGDPNGTPNPAIPGCAPVSTT